MLKEFIIGKIKVILLDVIIISVMFLILALTGTALDILFLVAMFKMIVIIVYLFLEYFKYKKNILKINQLKETIDKGYYIHEILQRPKNEETAIYYDLMVKANQDMITELAKYKKQYTDYREYIEEWIHEMKTPLTILGMLNSEDMNYQKKLNRQLKKLSDMLETSLYYIRSNKLEKDYQVEKINLKDYVHKVIMREKDLLISKKIELEVNCIENFIIYSDEKWLSFILHQIMLNAIKYVDEKGKIKIHVTKNDNSINFEIWDNGCGIKKSHLPRIFDKGFTGAKGHRGKASGIGLYLVKKCTKKMGIGIKAESELNQYTKITLIFPLNTYLSIL